MRRRDFIIGSISLGASVTLARSTGFGTSNSSILNVAYAGSMGAMMEGPVKQAVNNDLHLEMRGQPQGSNALAQLIAGGNIHPDVFLPVTRGPMRTVFNAGKAKSAVPVAHTEMVIAYSPRSRFAARFDAAARGGELWWRVLEEPGLRFGRTDPVTDPQGRNIIFTMTLAAKLYQQPNLVEKTLGAALNERQIFTEPSVEARLQSGELDAASAYKVQPGPFNIPYIRLPEEINLGSPDVLSNYPDLQLTLAGKRYRPEPLIYYAAVLDAAPNPNGAAAFVDWLMKPAAQNIFRRFQYDPAGEAGRLTI